MKISNFFTPIQFQERTYTNCVIEYFDSLVSNPFTKPIVVERRERTYQRIDQQPVAAPLLTAAKVCTYALLYFAPLIATSLLCCSLAIKFTRKIEPAPMAIPTRPDAPTLRNPPTTPKQNAIAWVQKFLCSFYHDLFALGITDLSLNTATGVRNDKILVQIGNTASSFERHFLETIPFFAVLLQRNGHWHESATPNEIRLTDQCPFTMKTLKQLETTLDIVDFDKVEELDPVELDFLGNSIVLAIVGEMQGVQPFQKWIADNNNNTIPKLGEIDLTPFSREKPQIKVASHAIPLKHWDLPELKVTTEFLQNDRTPAEIHGFLNDYLRGEKPEMCRYLTVNAVVEAFINQLVEQLNRNWNNQSQFPQLIQTPQPWHRYVTILSLSDPHFPQRELPQITAAFPNLRWLSYHFFQAEPVNLQEWIHTWNASCSHLRVLSLSGIDRPPANLQETLLREMPELDIFEIK